MLDARGDQVGVVERGANVSTAAAAAVGGRDRDRVRRDGQQAGAPCSARLLEQAAAPAHARDRERPSPVDRDAVGRERLVEPRGDVREHLVAALGARRRRRRRPSRSAASIARAQAAGA